jgi:hypothetical protein
MHQTIDWDSALKPGMLFRIRSNMAGRRVAYVSDVNAGLNKGERAVFLRTSKDTDDEKFYYDEATGSVKSYLFKRLSLAPSNDGSGDFL